MLHMDLPFLLTRRNLLELPLFCWLSSRWLGRAAAGPATHFRSQSVDGHWSLSYGLCPDAPRELPQTAPLL